MTPDLLLLSLLRRKELEDQLTKELGFHLEEHVKDLIARGYRPEEARRIARLSLGGPEQVREECGNAVIFADVLNDHGYLDQIRYLTAGNPETGLLVEQMIARKRELFADDERMIGDWEVTRTEDGINVRADARDPFSLPRHPTPGRRT